MKAVLGALGIDPAKLDIIITQLVMLKRGNVEVKISKRSGDLVTLRELVEEVGADACRFVFLSRSADSQMDFDIELAKKESSDNPAYYVQYAHARISSIFRLAQEKGIDFSRGNVTLLTTEAELDFIRKMLQLPEVVETVATKLEPHHLKVVPFPVESVPPAAYSTVDSVVGQTTKVFPPVSIGDLFDVAGAAKFIDIFDEQDLCGRSSPFVVVYRRRRVQRVAAG